ncbi:hypothetical protein GALMADRAFT_246000 [Galerina marginata CBS 339.88]|uniref:F-box domain-containing protein n=1 Tax=Galerina marginata (strain CBS 339.88) TaxID=685588 RepID=A0A067T185_GALM3|nr:hypothetical protein GALMADRAFT_246000 [Galerina marginata CBS 339.88]
MFLAAVPPELFAVFASHLPLHATPPTLLSLALVNRGLSGIALHLIHSCIVLKSEGDAAKMIQRLLEDVSLGRTVQELHIMYKPQSRDANGSSSGVVARLQDVIDLGLLPNMHTLGIKLVRWSTRKLGKYAKLNLGFFRHLRLKCPRCKGLLLENTGDTSVDHWLDGTGLFDIDDLSCLSLGMVSVHEFGKLENSLGSLSSTLHTLAISKQCDAISASRIFSLNFPVLRSLSLSEYTVDDTAEAMKFWNRHPSLEFIKCTVRELRGQSFFDNTYSPQFLPNLRHLKVQFSEVLTLARILHRLVSLEIHYSYNAQVPYLLQSVLPGGLPKLRSLFIYQQPSMRLRVVEDFDMESILYETKEWKANGFAKNLKVQNMSMSDGYMPSIVRGAPNLEELGLQGSSKDFTSLSSFVRDIYWSIMSNMYLK